MAKGCRHSARAPLPVGGLCLKCPSLSAVEYRISGLLRFLRFCATCTVHTHVHAHVHVTCTCTTCTCTCTCTCACTFTCTCTCPERARVRRARSRTGVNGWPPQPRWTTGALSPGTGHPLAAEHRVTRLCACGGLWAVGPVRSSISLASISSIDLSVRRRVFERSRFLCESHQHRNIDASLSHLTRRGRRHTHTVKHFDCHGGYVSSEEVQTSRPPATASAPEVRTMADARIPPPTPRRTFPTAAPRSPHAEGHRQTAPRREAPPPNLPLEPLSPPTLGRCKLARGLGESALRLGVRAHAATPPPL